MSNIRKEIEEILIRNRLIGGIEVVDQLEELFEKRLDEPSMETSGMAVRYYWYKLREKIKEIEELRDKYDQDDMIKYEAIDEVLEILKK